MLPRRPPVGLVITKASQQSDEVLRALHIVRERKRAREAAAATAGHDSSSGRAAAVSTSTCDIDPFEASTPTVSRSTGSAVTAETVSSPLQPRHLVLASAKSSTSATTPKAAATRWGDAHGAEGTFVPSVEPPQQAAIHVLRRMGAHGFPAAAQATPADVAEVQSIGRVVQVPRHTLFTSGDRGSVVSAVKEAHDDRLEAATPAPVPPARPIGFDAEPRPWPVPTEACQRVRGSVRTLRKDYRLFKAECGVMLQRTQASIDELMAGTLTALQASIGAQQHGP